MREINVTQFEQVANQSLVFIFVHTPFCGTCKLARKMLETLEEVNDNYHFLTLNGAIAPTLLQQLKIKSVPCLLIIANGQVEQKIYSFESVTNIYHHLQSFTR
ncbi:thioredoxin family protein [Aquibacillus salsiterrae]|uniref:Thioredoxin family protein n=1 Tax=Aquibacillus salsiterrae TaxID=2950439 RepID=A0A9X3WDJ1_9BACI|nr:thioredoxin family protein [Aquibacillus salsiterrae]MDC3417890.1 thioredoxin family protein [Aquibacillus salsiterrae]